MQKSGMRSISRATIFKAHRERIQEAATKLISRRRFEDDGTVLIRSADL